ncbi:MAG TPA: hypothetical protein VLW85_18425 [Myxococcales bacterium]|nr:hypothetical protein [Myxococcales bacterium]
MARALHDLIDPRKGGARVRAKVIAAALLLCSPALADEVAGDPAIGRALYTGAQRFEKGGPPCAACHAIGRSDALMAASFGPDLAKSDAALDLDVLDGVMADQPYHTMKPLYAGKPIGAAERAHVAMYIRSVAGGEPARAGTRIALQALSLAAAIALLLGWGRRRALPVREQLRRAEREGAELWRNAR